MPLVWSSYHRLKCNISFNWIFFNVNFLFVPCGRLSWLPVSFLLHVKYTLSYRIVQTLCGAPGWPTYTWPTYTWLTHLHLIHVYLADSHTRDHTHDPRTPGWPIYTWFMYTWLTHIHVTIHLTHVHLADPHSLDPVHLPDLHTPGWPMYTWKMAVVMLSICVATFICNLWLRFYYRQCHCQ